MWEEENPDPGGTGKKALSPQELTELKDQNEQQLVLIAQLKEMLKKEQSHVSQDKVEEYVNTISRARAKKSKQKKSDSSSSSSNTTSVNIDANKKERVNLLRRQLEENKARLAERGKSQKGIEEMVTQIQAQLKDSQTLVHSTTLSVSSEVKTLDYNENTPQKELYNILLTREKKITELSNKSQKLEGTILDLQENLKEKDSVIDARTKAITLMTDSLSKKGKNTLDALEETKDQMRKMQEHFVTLEAEMKARQLSLLNDLKLKNFEISELQEANNRLEKEKIELEQRLSERISPPIDISANVDFEALIKEVEKLQSENKHLKEFERLSENSDIKELQHKFDEVCQENLHNMEKIMELELKLKDNLSKLDAQDTTHEYSLQSDLLEKNKQLMEENEKLCKENSELLIKVHETERELEEALSKLRESECNEESIKRILQENDKLSKQNIDYKTKLQELERQLEDSLTELNILRNTGMGGASSLSKDGNEEITKLKKQLDESNKSMIKMRATQKSKIKELNKKLDQFRKMNDANALIAQLQNEISKLNERIAELEDEKGNLQLKMVDSTTSSKEGADIEEEIKQLKEKLNKTEQELGEKDKVIEILEMEVLTLKADLKKKSEEAINISNQVSSEMSSIDYEEQIEGLESDKKKLLEQIITINAEKEIVLQELELVKKEKQDINTKLESYIQENMELIDKLEKLSAEKVSSAESIEIVEGLTHQEKLELAAYQKHINSEGSPDEDTIEAPAELNESVLQLSEDTAELLQKIEMFTQERKEVMQKMETLKEENNTLTLKIKEIENNRDILEETYEQLQNEKDVLLTEKEDLANKLEKLEKHAHLEKDERFCVNILDSELKDMQKNYEALMQENDELKRTLKEVNSMEQEKLDLGTQLQDVIDNNASLDTKLNSNLDEINAYQLTIEDNKKELINSTETIHKLQNQLESRQDDIQELHINISDLNSVISELQSKQNNFDDIETELNNLKSALNDHIIQARDYESEIAQNSDTIRALNEDLISMNRRILELENELELKDTDIEKLKKDVINKDEIIRNLQVDIEKKDHSFKIVNEDMKAKYLELKKHLDSNDGQLQNQISELSSKNKEQLEKMKKIAANLKKKSQAYQDLEEQYRNEKEKWETEDKEKTSNIAILKNKLEGATQALEDAESRLKIQIEKHASVQEELAMLKEQIEILEQTNADQQHYIQELKHKQDKLQEVSLQQEMSDSLHEDVDTSFSKQVPDDKIRELQLQLETNESELSHYQERFSRTQEELRKLQEAKSELEAVNNELVEKLNLTSNSFKEKALLEDQLELRLAEVTANDEALVKKLQEIQNERDELVSKNQEHEELIRKLKIKLKRAHEKVTELKVVQENLQVLETVNQELRNQVASLEDNQRHIQSENESLQRRNLSDYDKIEADYQMQLEELFKVKNELTTENEKLLERIKELEDHGQGLAMELDEYKARVAQIEKNSLEEIKLLKEELETEKSQNQNILYETNVKLTESVKLVECLSKELDGAKKQLNNLDTLRTQLEDLTLERNHLSSSLEDANYHLEKVMSESNELKQALQQSQDELHASLGKVQNLIVETERLKQEILALEFAKSSLEASCESYQKLEKPTQCDGDLELPVHRTDLTSEKLNLVLKGVQDMSNETLSETESLQTQLAASKRELHVALSEVDSLKSEVIKLREQINTLQLANSNLNILSQSKEKPTQPDHVIVPEISGEVIEVDHGQQNVIPLFSAFAQPTSDPVFDSFGLNQSVVELPKQGIETHTSLTSEMPLKSSQPNQDIQPQLCSSVVDNGREALLKKIKALEFLLYSVDKEKEIALDQCTELLNELTQIIYNKTDLPQKQETPKLDFESEILSQENIDNLCAKTSLQQTEYTPSNKNYGEKSAPVNEEIGAKTAYICFEEGASSKTNETFTDLDSQILSEKEIAGKSSNKKELQKLEYTKVEPYVVEQKQPIIEPLAQPKHAYLCYTKDDKPQSLEAFEENDDGWGWGPEEARLEEEHMNTLENMPQVKSLLLEIQQLKENIRVLQVERDNHLDEIKQLQIKSGKLIKKCKELKAKNDQATTNKKTDDAGFFDLNETIQEELKLQVQQLEKKLKELTVEYEKEKSEKNNLLKRVDVLTAANDKMTEMKEIQDSEVLRWQRKYQEATQKIQEYEWGSDGFGESQKHVADTPQASSSISLEQNSKIKELEETIKELSLDNEELQILLEEQIAKTKILEAESNKSSGKEEELAELRSLNETLHKELIDVKLKSDELQTEINNILSERDKLIEEKLLLESIVQEKEIIIDKIQMNTSDRKEQYLDLHENEISELKAEISDYQTRLNEKDSIITNLQVSLNDLTEEKSNLHEKVTHLSEELIQKAKEIQQLQLNFDQSTQSNFEVQELKSQIEHLNNVIQENKEVIDLLNDNIDQFKTENCILEDNQEELYSKLQNDEETIRKIKMEKDDLNSKYEKTLENLQTKIREIEEGQALITDLETRLEETENYDMEKARIDAENQTLVRQLQIKSQELEEKQMVLNKLQLIIAENSQATVKEEELLKELDKKTSLIEELEAEKLAKDEEIQRLFQELQNKEQEFQDRINALANELNEKWQLEVDQRGADVAESWKAHLEMVEKEYTSVQEKLKSDVLELEEKCNILLTENNELRKNVDHEIRNEVDKMSALQHELCNLQQTINSLNQVIQDRDKQIEELQKNVSDYMLLKNELQILQNENVEKTNKLASLNIIIETTQKQFDEKREVVEEIISILDKQAPFPVSSEKQDVIREFQRQLGIGIDKDSEVFKLTQLVEELRGNIERLTGEKNREIIGLNQVIEDLEKEVSIIHEKEAEIVRLSTELNNIHLERERLQKDIEIIRGEKENLALELDEVKREHSNCLTTIEECNRKVENYYTTQTSLQHSLDEKSQEICNLNQRIIHLQEEAKNDSNKEMEELNTTLAKVKEEYLVLQGSLSDCQNELFTAKEKLAEITQQLEKANETIILYQQNQMYYEQENIRLKELLDHSEKEYNNSLEMLRNNQLADIQKHYDELLSNKDVDINTLRGQIKELVDANQSYVESLNQELANKQQLEQQLKEQTQIVDEDTKQLEELKLIIEDQVTKIEELKKELFEKSNQYDSLIAQIDVGRQPITRQPSTSHVANTSTARQYTDEDLSEPVSRAELDIALYMLHQRDVRCEELTVELTQLLEERDTLQLRLSNAIREKEELRRSIAGDNPQAPSTSSSSEVSPNQSKSSAIFLAASGTELAKDPLESEQHLATKLSELKNMGYKRDKTFVDDQEARRFQQLAIMQQHINEASKLPPEAAAKLVDASYTLSRDVQSPSKVLLNWLWGKNPPKANDS